MKILMVLVCFLSVLPGLLHAETVDEIVIREAKANGIDPNLVRAVIYAESNGNRFAVSHKEAKGLMQLIPATAERFGVKDVFDPAQNIKAGTRYLKWLYKRFESWPLALAGYNAGEGKVDRYKGIPPYKETQTYVKKVMRKYRRLSGNEQTVPSLINLPVVPTVVNEVFPVYDNIGSDKTLYEAALVSPTAVSWTPPEGYYN